MDKKSPSVKESSLVDHFLRTISYLRVSVTDHCNLRCLYCVPKGKQAKLAMGELLTYEELLRVIGLAVRLGIQKVRLTGGEPLVRKDIIGFVESLSAMPGLEDIRMTTNGVLLPKFADRLYDAGMRKLNISLDTLQREKYRQITGSDCFQEVWAGISLAEQLQYDAIKVNMVAMRGVNDDELADFAQLSLERPLQMRFIEFMPVGKTSSWEKDKYMPMAEIMERVQSIGELEPVHRSGKDGPAKVFRFKGGLGSIGFISPISNHFCDQCNRLRLTSEGKLRSCLLSDKEVDLKGILRSGGGDELVTKAIVETVMNKPKGHTIQDGEANNCHGEMSRIGG